MPCSNALNQKIYVIPFTKIPLKTIQNSAFVDGSFNDEKMNKVGIKKINAVKKYIKTLIVLSKLYFLPITENKAKTSAPDKARMSPVKLVNLIDNILPWVIIMITPAKLISIEISFLRVIFSLRIAKAKIKTNIGQAYAKINPSEAVVKENARYKRI